MKKVLVIAGPTASGKTSFSIQMAKLLHGLVISGDSVQVYKGVNIGSGKITEKEKEGVPHALIDILDPRERYSAYDFQKMARPLIEQNQYFPIIAGGTGLYLKACLYDYDFREEEGESQDPALEEKSTEELYAMLQDSDPMQAEKIHPHNRRRILRALTILEKSGQRMSDIEKEQHHEMIYDAFIAGCTMPREILYERINQRVDQMFEDGLEEEVKGLLDQGYQFTDPGLRGIGYKEFRPYFDGECTIDDVREAVQRNSRHYAKRQYTWLRHQMPVRWFNILDENERNDMVQQIMTWSRG